MSGYRQIEATAEVDDGGQELVLRLSNFLAGDRLEFTVDVDEVLRNAVDLAVFNGRLDVITLGQEFQDSILEATFNAPHYETSHADAVFLNDYGDPASSHELNLPADESNNADSRSSRSAAAVASTTQTSKPVAGVQVQLVPINTLAPQSVLTVTSAGNGSYSFTGLAPGSYEVIEVDQPSYQNVWIDRARTVNERTAGHQEKFCLPDQRHHAGQR